MVFLLAQAQGAGASRQISRSVKLPPLQQREEPVQKCKAVKGSGVKAKKASIIKGENRLVLIHFEQNLALRSSCLTIILRNMRVSGQI